MKQKKPTKTTSEPTLQSARELRELVAAARSRGSSRRPSLPAVRRLRDVHCHMRRFIDIHAAMQEPREVVMAGRSRGSAACSLLASRATATLL